MTFLNPAVLIGLIAATIPVIIHLLNLRKLKKIEFSTLAFLKELQKNKIRKIKIKQWLLLLLRVLIILFIVFAFARPALRGLSIAGTTSAAKTTAVIIVDDTFSMSVLSQNGSYFNQAKDFAKKIIEQLKEGDEAALIFLSESYPKKNLTNDFGSLISELNQKDISYGKPQLNIAIATAAQLVNMSNNFNREIYILSDLQKNIFPSGEVKSDLSEILNEYVKLYSITFSEKSVFNLGVDELKINTQIFEKDRPITFSVSVTNYSDQNLQNGVLSLFLNNKRSAQKSFDVEAGKSVLVDIEAISDAAGFIDVVAEIETDDIEDDNKRFSSLFIPDKISVLIISDENSASRFLKFALQTIGSEKISIDEKNSNQLGGLQLKNYDVVFLCSENSVQYAAKLNQFLIEGGNLVIIPSINPDISKINDLLQKFNLPLAAGFAGKLNDKSLSLQFEKLEFGHPVFLNLFKNDDKKNIESPSVNYFLKYLTQGKGSSIISLTEGSSFLSEFKSGNGKILFFNTAFDPSWSNFPIKTIFAPLIVKTVFYLSQKENLQKNLLAGDPIKIDLNRVKSVPVKIVKPDSTTDFLNIDLTNQKFVEYTNTNLAGFYKIFSDNQQIDNIAINFEPSESNPVYSNEKDLEKYLEQINFKGNFIIVDKNKNPFETINQARFGSELWRIFLMVAIILAITEMTLARNVKKEVQGIITTN